MGETVNKNNVSRALLRLPESDPGDGGLYWDSGTLKKSLGVDPGSAPAGITEYWYYGNGMYQDSGMTSPVTADGQTIAKWVGVNGTVLTCTSIVAQSVGGRLVPKNNAEGYFTLPNTYSMNRRDLTVLMHLQRPECFSTKAYFGFDKDGRACELINYGDIRNLTYDGTTLLTHASTARASAFTITLRNNASALKVGVNGNEITATAMASGTMLGGKFGALQDGSVQGADRYWGLALGTYLTDGNYTSAIEWARAFRTPPSETAPAYNIAIFADSQGGGLNAGGHSWILDLADNFNARIIPIVGSAQYFRSGGSPQNASSQLTQVGLEYKSGAGRNIVIIATTNDFDQGTGAGAAYMASAKTAGQTFQNQGWEVWIAKQPNRTAPYSNATSFNTQVTTFNGLITSDPWMDGSIDFSSLSSYLLSDGIHWTSAGQTVAYNQAVSALGLT